MSSTTPVSTDSSSLLARLHPSHYLSTHLSHSSRPSSSRSPLDFPDVDLNLGPIASSSSSNRPEWLPSPSALARIGPTTVICNITPSIVYPPQMSTPSSSQAGSTVVPSINLTPLSSPSADFKSGAPSNFAQCTTERLYEFLDSSLPFEPEVLHIPTEGGEAAGAGVEEAKRGPPRAKWCLFADCTVVGYDGALLETAMLAITAALRQREYTLASRHLLFLVLTFSPPLPPLSLPGSLAPQVRLFTRRERRHRLTVRLLVSLDTYGLAASRLLLRHLRRKAPGLSLILRGGSSPEQYGDVFER